MAGIFKDLCVDPLKYIIYISCSVLGSYVESIVNVSASARFAPYEIARDVKKAKDILKSLLHLCAPFLYLQPTYNRKRDGHSNVIIPEISTISVLV